MPQRTSVRRKSTSSVLFPKKKRRNESSNSKKAQSSADAREQQKTQARLKNSQKERDAATIKLYDAQALNSIDEQEFLQKSLKEQNLQLFREVRAIKMVSIKTRRVQHTEKKASAVEFKVTVMMKDRMTKFVCNVIYGNTVNSDARQNLTTFPMELWVQIRIAILNDYITREDPIAQQWARDSDAALVEGKIALKKIRQRLYNCFTTWMRGKKGKQSAVKIASRIQMNLEKEFKIGEDEYDRLTAYTRFESRFADKIGVETDLIEIGSDYGVVECNNVIDCVGDILHSYMKYRKLQSWKINCKRMIKCIEKFHSLMREELKAQDLPDTLLEFPDSETQQETSIAWSDWEDASEDPKTKEDQAGVSKIADVMIMSDSDDEEIQTSQRELASDQIDEIKADKKKGGPETTSNKRSRSLDDFETWRKKKPKLDKKKTSLSPTLSFSLPQSPPPLETIES